MPENFLYYRKRSLEMKNRIVVFCLVLGCLLTACQTKPEESKSSQLANPWVAVTNFEEAQTLTGIDVTFPDSFEGYSIDSIQVDNQENQKIISVTYTDGSNEIIIRKGSKTENISGDLNTYSNRQTLSENGRNVEVKGNGSTWNLALWDDSSWSYSIDSQEGLSLSFMETLVSEVQ